MRKMLALICMTAILAISTAQAEAQNIKGKVGVTARLGFLIPADSDYNDNKLETDAGFNFGGGFIYGIDKNWAAEIDITRTEFGSNRVSGANTGDFEVTNISLGGQYRFEINHPTLTPYVGAGLDILLSDYSHPQDSVSVDTTVGVHASGGIDYFLTRNIALNAEGKVVVAPETDINGPSGRKGNFDPSSFSGMFGVRFFFN
ncbi:outer membrane beta-barrel protein [Geobacter pelophilus]|uniref:Outer membrane beta-barrel protein n=1 Tax=Geoanaerobacter pelophilus TaxID=60036 RepID=A0AAW4KYX0_9BACT|nr:porin family protein [Geoanaerobacter pelophilus]MBT0663841.1 outer membrane beta-barrel protein [Geoanaerobacter pelophilus]